MSFCTTIEARRRREAIQEQLRKNRAKTQALIEARRRALNIPPPCCNNEKRSFQGCLSCGDPCL